MAIYTKLQPADLEKIAADYGLTIMGVSPLEGGNSNSNYRILTEEGQFMLSLVEEKSFLEAQNWAKLLQWLAEHDFMTTPVYPSLRGKLVIRYSNKPLMAKKWISGEVLEQFSNEMLQQIGFSLAHLHLIPAPSYLAKDFSFGMKFFSEILNIGIDLEYEAWLNNKLHFLKKQLPKKLPRGLIHGDLFFDNVLFEKGRIKAIIDFEEACFYYLIFDLGMAALGLCRPERVIDLPKVRALIEGYEQVRSLDSIEKEHLQLFIEYAAISISCWRYWRYNFYTPKPGSAKKHREMVQVVKELDKWPKEDFMRVVFR